MQTWARQYVEGGFAWGFLSGGRHVPSESQISHSLLSGGLCWLGRWARTAHSVLNSEKRSPAPFSPLPAHVQGKQRALRCFIPLSYIPTTLSPRKAQKPHPVPLSKAWQVHFLTRDIKAQRIPCIPSAFPTQDSATSQRPQQSSYSPVAPAHSPFTIHWREANPENTPKDVFECGGFELCSSAKQLWMVALSQLSGLCLCCQGDPPPSGGAKTAPPVMVQPWWKVWGSPFLQPASLAEMLELSWSHDPALMSISSLQHVNRDYWCA